MCTVVLELAWWRAEPRLHSSMRRHTCLRVRCTVVRGLTLQGFVTRPMVVRVRAGAGACDAQQAECIQQVKGRKILSSAFGEVPTRSCQWRAHAAELGGQLVEFLRHPRAHHAPSRR